MEKVIAINLNGRAYQLEEAGFDALRTYLDEAGARLASNPGKSEIIADLEQAIAEKCDRLIGMNKNVIGAAEITRIIAEMGPVEGEAHAGTEEEKKESAHANAPKRLYRIEEGRIIWGVCTGLAAYFGVDVALVRILFVILAIITGGGALLGYFAMMMLIPEADTMQDKAAAHGEPFNAQELVNRAKAEYQRWSVHLSSAHEAHAWSHEMRRAWKRERKTMYRAARTRRRNPFFGMLHGALAVVWILALISLITTGAIFGWAIPASIPLWIAIVLLFILYHAVTGPMRGATHTAYRDEQYTEWDGVGDGLTVLFLAIAFVWAYLHLPAVHDFVFHPITEIKLVVAHLKAWWHAQ